MCEDKRSDKVGLIFHADSDASPKPGVEFLCCCYLIISIEILQRNTMQTLEWFNFNSMAANPAKFQVMFLGIKDSSQLEFKIGNNILKPTNFVKLLVVTIDCRLNFDQHIALLCSTASKKVKALFCIRSFNRH